MKPRYSDNLKLCYMATDSFIMDIKQEVFIKILQVMLKKDLIHPIMNVIDHYLQERIKK